MSQSCTSSTVEICVPSREFDWVLEIQDRRGARRVPLVDGLVLGSAASADVCVDDPTVSANHCALRVREGRVEVVDLDSKNGTFIGSARVERAWALAGSVVTLGNSSVLVASAESADDDDGDDSAPLEGVAGASFAMRRVAAQVARLAHLSAPVLVAGESGTGKELVARALHQQGARASRQFIPLNVAALPRELVESEMFGHERGAFTGAMRDRRGAFSEADGGTLFLDEIGELPLDAQPKLLRALDGYEVRRVGASGAGERADVRLIAATHAPLETRVAEGRFRRDLFHRLEVFVINIPPLRERRGDIAAIAEALLARAASEIGDVKLSSAAIGKLCAQPWPGNVRELRNVLYRAAHYARAGSIGPLEVERALRGAAPGVASTTPAMTFTPDGALRWLERHQGNLSAAARNAGIPRTTFRKLLSGRTSGSVRGQ